MFRWVKNYVTPSKPARPLSVRLQGIECLESRVVLSGVPQVADVEISSSSWSSSFKQELESQGYGDGGYSVLDNSSTVAWSGIDTIKIEFSENVDVDGWDLVVKGVNQSEYSISSFSYDASTYTATWTLSGNVDTDRILLDLDGNGSDPAADADGTSMSRDFHTEINVMPGNVRENGGTPGSNYVLVAQKSGASIGDSDYSVLYDINGDGQISDGDLSIVGTHIGESLPSVSESGNDAPTILNFQATRVYGDLWSFTGDVVDPDDTVGPNYTIMFGALLNGHTTYAGEDGSFAYYAYLSHYGIVLAGTQDPHGNYSDAVSTSVSP